MDRDAIESGIPSVTPANVESKEGLEKNYFPSNGCGKVRSRYLRATIGSCHDLCKYGKKIETEDEGKQAMFRRFMENRILSVAVLSHVKGVKTDHRRKTTGLHMRASGKAKVLHQNMQAEGKEVGKSENPVGISIGSPSPLNESMETSEELILSTTLEHNIQSQVENHNKPQSLLKTIVVTENSTTVELEASSCLENDTIEILPCAVLQDSPDNEVNHMKHLNLNVEKKQAIKPKNSPMPDPSPVKRHILKQKNSLNSAEITSCSGSNIFKEKVASYMKETVTSSALKAINLKNMAVSKSSASPKFQSFNQNVSLPSRKVDGNAKRVISLKESAPLVRPTTQLNASRNLNARRHWDRKVSKSFEMPKVGEMKSLKLRNAYISSTTPTHGVVSLRAIKHRSLEHAAHERDVNSEGDVGDIHEKAQEVIEAKSENNGTDANDENFNMEGDGYISESVVTDFSELSESEEMQSKQNHRFSGEEEKRRTRRTPALQLDDNSSSPYVLKFKRGTVIELGPTETVSPRRLRFRRARVLRENPDGEGIKRISRRRRDMHDMKAPSAVAHANSSEANSVMLKHQDVQKKKYLQALFNQVIEETASKLVEHRKSKVKALVSAFETVMSLQDTKAAPLVLNS